MVEFHYVMRIMNNDETKLIVVPFYDVLYQSVNDEEAYLMLEKILVNHPSYVASSETFKEIERIKQNRERDRLNNEISIEIDSNPESVNNLLNMAYFFRYDQVNYEKSGDRIKYTFRRKKDARFE